MRFEPPLRREKGKRTPKRCKRCDPTLKFASFVAISDLPRLHFYARTSFIPRLSFNHGVVDSKIKRNWSENSCN